MKNIFRKVHVLYTLMLLIISENPVVFSQDRASQNQKPLIIDPNQEAYKNALIVAVGCNDRETTAFLIRRGVPVGLRMPDNEPLFHRALKVFRDTEADLGVKPSAVELIKLLLSNGADPNLEDSDGITPLMVATRANSERVRLLLLNAGARKYDDSTLINQARYVKIDADLIYQIGDYCMAMRHGLFSAGRKRISFSLLEEEAKIRYGEIPLLKNKGKDSIGNSYTIIYDTSEIVVIIHRETIARFKGVVSPQFWKPFRREDIDPFMGEAFSEKLFSPDR